MMRKVYYKLHNEKLVTNLVFKALEMFILTINKQSIKSWLFNQPFLLIEGFKNKFKARLQAK